MARKRVTSHTAYVLHVGDRPVPDMVEEDGTLNFRPWQAECVDTLGGKNRCLLIAPTASGKSTAMKALSGIFLKQGLKVVIAVPQSLIADSFAEARIRLSDGTVLDWCAGVRLIDEKESLRQLREFLLEPPATTHKARTLICTHQAAVLVHQELIAAGYTDPWGGCAVLIDEGHRSKSGEVDLDGEVVAESEVERVLRNRLGSMVAHLLTKDSPLVLATATWMRTDWIDIVPRSEEPNFTKYVLPVERFLEGMEHLREIAFRFVVGEPEEALRFLMEERVCPTLVYLPPVNSYLSTSRGGKFDTLKAYQRVVGPITSRDAWTVTHRRKVRAVDLVDPTDRNERKAALLRTIKQKARVPDLIWALNMAKEGFDCPPLERSIVMGPRGSILDIIQMLGRLLRDYPNKKRVEFNVVLPFSKSEEDPYLLRDYLKIMLASMVIEWQFKPIGIRDLSEKGREAIERLRMNHGKFMGAISAVVDAAIGDGDEDSDPVQLIEGAIRAGHLSLGDEEERNAISRHLADLFLKKSRDVIASKLRAELHEAGEIPFDPNLVEDTFGCVRTYATTFGFNTLKELRESIGRVRPFTMDYIKEKILEFHRDAVTAQLAE